MKCYLLNHNKTAGAACAVLCLILMVLMVSGIFACAFLNGPVKKQQGDLWQEVGWIDDNTYRIMAEGEPSPHLEKKDVDKRKESSKKAAILNAKFSLMKKFSESITDKYMDPGHDTNHSVAFEKILGTIIEDGRVIAERYDQDGNCEIIFEISSEGLRKRFESP